MSAAPELLPKWSAGADPAVKSKGVVLLSSFFRLSMKEFTSWHSRISNLIFFCVLGAGTILCVVTSLNAVGHFRNPESEFLSSSTSSLPSQLKGVVNSSGPSDSSLGSTNNASDAAPPSMLMPNPVDLPNLSDVYHNTSGPSDLSLGSTNNASDAAPPSMLMPNPVDLSNLSDVYHNMSDEELLLRASGSALSRPRSASVTPKVAFLFLARGPMPLAPLWERYFKGHVGLYSIYLHAHPNYRPEFPPGSVFYRRNIPSKEVFWGRITVYEAERRLLANALLDAANERFIHLSESCIPIAPFPVAYKYFTESEHSFVDVFDDPGRGGLGRYNRIKHREKLNPEITPSQWRKGAQWFEMSRALARMVVADRKYLPKFQSLVCMDDCICYSEEHYIPTLLTILAASKLANRTTTFVDFHLHNAHPKKWEPDEITAGLLQSITTGSNCTYNGKVTETCHMFARKFSPGTIKPLLKLAATSFGIP